MGKPTDRELRPYGFVRGPFNRYCAGCNRQCGGMQFPAYKCETCAIEQFKQVERDIKFSGIEAE